RSGTCWCAPRRSRRGSPGRAARTAHAPAPEPAGAPGAPNGATGPRARSDGGGRAHPGALGHLAALLAEHRVADHGDVGAEGPVALHIEADGLLERGDPVREPRLEVLDELVRAA